MKTSISRNSKVMGPASIGPNTGIPKPTATVKGTAKTTDKSRQKLQKMEKGSTQCDKGFKMEYKG